MLVRAARLFFSHPKVTLLLVAASVLAAVASARTLRVDSDLVSLLPRSFDSVRGLDEYRARGGSVGYAVLLLKGEDPDALLAYAQGLTEPLGALEVVDSVEFHRPAAFFEDRLLYYLEVDELEALAERIEERADYERRKSNPLLVDLVDSGPPEVTLDVPGRLPRGLARRRGPHYFDEDRGTLLVLVKPRGLASDLAFAERVVADVSAALAAHPPGPGVTVQLGGRFPKRVEQQRQLQSDLRLTSLVALALVFGYLALYFRRPRAVLVLLAPLGVGLAWTFGATALAFGELNVLTAFVGAILLGLGIDHGLHMLEGYQAELGRGGTETEALAAAFGRTGRAATLAALTTALGFAGLAISEFRAFREFGLVAALGGLLVLIAYVVCLPALLSTLGVGAKVDPAPRRTERLARALLGWRRPVLVATTGFALALLAQVSLLSFDYDFARLDGGGEGAGLHDPEIDEILGRQQASVAILADDEAQAAAAALNLRARQRAEGSGIDFVVSTRDLIPPRQDEKQDLLQRIADEVTRVDPEQLPSEQRDAFERLQVMVAQAPFSVSDLPGAVRRELLLSEPSRGGLVIVYPSVSMSDGQAILSLAEQLRDVPLPDGGTVSATGEAMVLADVLGLVFRETPRALAATGGLVFLALLVTLRDLRRATIAYAPAIVTVAATLGAAGAVGLELNYLNVVFLPVLFGMAVDAGVHLATGPARADAAFFAEKGRAVLGASLTTAAGFGALCLAHHPGLRSLGQLAVLGVAVSLAVALVWLPALVACVARPAAGPPDPEDGRITPPPSEAVI